MEFTYKAYSEIINLLRENGYAIVDYSNCFDYNKRAILRHDIDYSVEKALDLAKLESKLGVQSNYFVMLTSPFYNIACKKVNDQITEIANLGHKIGLHFDEKNYSLDFYNKKGGIKEIVLKEIEIMEHILEVEISSVSMHRPSIKTLEANYDFGKIINSYSTEFFKNYKYISDSRRRWRENISDIISGKKFDKLHILTHAFWYNQKNKEIDVSLKEFISKACSERYNDLDNNISNLENLITKESKYDR